MTDRPKLSVIIPTCDRPDTLRASLKTLLMQEAPDIEIVVSDNAGDPRTHEVVNGFSDPRLVYLRTGRRLGMSEHWEFALSRTHGDWITVIGDDDGLLPGSVDRFLALAESLPVKAISARRCHYTWPGALDGKHGKLTVFGDGGEEIRNSEEWLARVVKEGWSYKDLPGIYTGDFVKRSVMEEIRNKTGRYFSSIIPDLYSSVAIASVIPEYFFSQIPFAISGASSHSTGQKYFKAKKPAKESMAFFSENKMTFHESLGNGFVQSKTFLVYESYVQSQALRDTPPVTGLKEQIWLALASADEQHLPGLMEYFSEVSGINALDFRETVRAGRGYLLRYKLKRRFRKIFKRRDSLPRGFKATFQSDAIDDVYEAALFAERVIANRGKEPKG